ncbi:RxLR effector protein [Phytophthora megakarya]|uniref:RxLR effector protein n=1 Tax=Phytophthora megakarya TaxID=4795 RepID=A0A225VZA9_9STRA|nr:RxLR effector protein [Phytophthora megakarya]
MRVCFVLLAAITIISGNTAINAEPTSILTKTSTSETHAINSALDNANTKRFLRSHEVPEDDDDVKGIKAVEEERLSRQALNNLLDGNYAHKFALWKGKNYSAAKIYSKLGVSIHRDRLNIYNAYVKYLK